MKRGRVVPWNAAEMQASSWPGSGSKVSSKYILTRELSWIIYRESTTSSSTQTWHSLNADKGVLSTKQSSSSNNRISIAITITVTVLAHLSLAHKACCVHNIQMNDVVNVDLWLNTSTKS